MDLDIIKRIKNAHFKASFENLGFSSKFFLILFLLSFIVNLMPHAALAQYDRPQGSDNDPGPALVFDSGNSDYQDFLDQKSELLTDLYYQAQVRAQAARQVKLTAAVAQYLADHNSPLAQYANILVSQRNWKKIIALSNAESSMCRKYRTDLANCWGIGGVNLWDMGQNLGEGVVTMNSFLNNYPKRSHIKYAEMSFENMNGLYKQPPAQHWVDNNELVYDDLVQIENSIQ